MPHHRPAQLVLLAVAALLLGCATPDPAPGFPPLSFTDKPPVKLAVAQVMVINEYPLPFEPPHIEHQMPVAPGPAAERWGIDVLRAANGSGRVQFVITEASVQEVDLKVTGGLKGLFTVDQSVRYEARLVVRLDLLDGRNRRLAQVETSVTRSQTAPEDITPNERAALWYELTKRLLDDFDTAIRPRIKQHLGPYLR